MSTPHFERRHWNTRPHPSLITRRNERRLLLTTYLLFRPDGEIGYSLFDIRLDNVDHRRRRSTFPSIFLEPFGDRVILLKPRRPT